MGGRSGAGNRVKYKKAKKIKRYTELLLLHGVVLAGNELDGV